MKKTIKNIFIITFIMLIVLNISKRVNAANEAEMSLTSSSKLKAGENVTIDINVTKIPEGGIGSIMGKLVYDSNVLEYIGVEGNADWVGVFTASNKILGVERNNNTTTTGKIATIKFKVKDGISKESTEVKYEVSDMGLSELISLTPKIILKADSISESSSDTAVPTLSSSESILNNTSTTSTQKSNINGKQIQQSTANKKILSAGDIKTKIIVISVIVILFIFLRSLLKYRKNKDIK